MRALEQIWWEYPFVVDFLLYFLFFGALVRAALSRQFGDAAAKRLSVALGLSLAMGLVVAKDRIGFAMEDFAPMAIALIVLTAGIVAYRLLRFADVPAIYSALFSLFLVVVVVRTLNVAVDGIDSFLPEGTATVLWVAIGLVTWHGIAKSHGFSARRSRDVQQMVGKRVARQNLERQRDLIGQEVSTQKRRTMKKGKSVEHDLHKVSKQVSSRPQKETAERVHQELKRIEEDASRIAANMARLGRLDRALREFDLDWLKKASKADFRRIGRYERNLLKENIQLERARLGVELRLDALARDSEAHTLRVRELTRRAQESVETAHPEILRQLVSEARAEQRRTNAMNKAILAQERVLLQLLNKQIRLLR